MELRADDAFCARSRGLQRRHDSRRRALGQLSDLAAEQHLAATVIKRRDKIARAYLPTVNPVVNPRLDANGELTFDNAAVAAGITHRRIGPRGRASLIRLGDASDRRPRSATIPPRRLPSTGGVVEIDISAESPAYPSWHQPVRVLPPIGWRLETGRVGEAAVARPCATPSTSRRRGVLEWNGGQFWHRRRWPGKSRSKPNRTGSRRGDDGTPGDDSSLRQVF